MADHPSPIAASRQLSLAEIAARHSCDKGYHGPSARWNGNNYAATYEAYLHDRREEPLSLLEIGLGVTGPNWRADIVHGSNAQGGASMKMWADYLPNARITGLDINPATFLDTDRITTYQADQGSRESLAAFLDRHPEPRFDIIIDDGSHRPDHQQITLEMLWPHLKSGGTYFIEDLSDFGHGARQGSRHGSDAAVPTRALFKRYARTGEVREPNAFETTGFFSEIADILLYAPRPLLRARDAAIEALRIALGRSPKGMSRLEWADDSEQMVAIRKR
jgi:hypothetical protein